MDGIFLILIILAGLGLVIGKEYPRALVSMFCDVLVCVGKMAVSVMVTVVPPLAALIAKLTGAVLVAAHQKLTLTDNQYVALIAAKAHAQAQPVEVSVPISTPTPMGSAPTAAKTAPQATNFYYNESVPQPKAVTELKKNTQSDDKMAQNPYMSPPDIDIKS